MVLEILREPPAAIVSDPLISPPNQLAMPPTVSVAVPFKVAPLNVKLLTAEGVFTVSAALIDTVALSVGPGTWFGDQFAAVFQFPPALLVQVKFAPNACG